MIEFSSEMGLEELRARVEDARARGADVRLEETPPPPPLPRGLEYVRLDQVQHAPRNPKGHDPVIGRMIVHHGLGEIPLRDDRTGRLVAGHGRHEQLVAMHASGASAPDGITVDPDGMWRMPVITGWSSRSDPDAEAYLVGSNESAAAGGWEIQGLAEVLAVLKEAELIDLTGFSVEYLDDLDRLLAPPDLDTLAAQVGVPTAEDRYVVIRVEAEPSVRAEFERLMARTERADPAQAFAQVVAWAGSSCAQGEGAPKEPGPSA